MGEHATLRVMASLETREDVSRVPVEVAYEFHTEAGTAHPDTRRFTATPRGSGRHLTCLTIAFS